MSRIRDWLRKRWVQDLLFVVVFMSVIIGMFVLGQIVIYGSVEW